MYQNRSVLLFGWKMKTFNEIPSFLNFFFRQNYMQNYSYEIYAIIIKTASHKYCDGESFFPEKKNFSLSSKYDEDFIVLINKTLKWWMLMTLHICFVTLKKHISISSYFFSWWFLFCSICSKSIWSFIIHEPRVVVCSMCFPSITILKRG